MNSQVEQVRVRLLLSDVIASIRQHTGLDQNELTQVINLCVERHGLSSDIEVCVLAYYNNWRSNPRLTLTEHVRLAMKDKP